MKAREKDVKNSLLFKFGNIFGLFGKYYRNLAYLLSSQCSLIGNFTMAFSLSSQNISQYLLDSGLCKREDSEFAKVEPQEFAKNFNLLVSFPNHCKLLVKQERRSQNGKTAHEFFNEWQFHRLLQYFPDLSSIGSWVSEAIYFDEHNSILVYNYLSEYFDLASFYYQEQVFPTAIANTVGTVLAVLHCLTFNRQEYHDFIAQMPEGKLRYQFGNPAQRLKRIGPEIFGSVPAAGLKFFILYQRYQSLQSAIADLETHWAPCCLTHNDLKLNNILVHQEWQQLSSPGKSPDDGIVRLIDWERCAWGDPAFDLGNLFASYLGIWLSSLVVDPSIELEESLRLAVIPLEVLQPSIAVLTQAYLKTFPLILEYRCDFLKRVVQFAGLALIHQIEAMIHYQKSFNNTGICMLQVAKSLLCRPEQSMLTVFGIPETDLIRCNSTPS